MRPIRSDFLASLSYEPDRFQISAMDAIDEDASVLVAAPTGSGKTLIAEYAIARMRAMGKRTFYTTPIKALSNQKLRDLSATHGAHNVGLVTGDNAVNPDAPIVVMTTEVLRNMIYADSDRLTDLGAVILDEVHYLQDAYRGPVWEEVIIQLDPHIQLVCLSATVSNADEVGQWLHTVRGRTDVVVETTRPIELVNMFAYFDKASAQTVMHPTIVAGEANRQVQRLLAGGRETNARRHGGQRRPRNITAPTRPEIVDLLHARDMLPAIVFIFSRAQCEDAVRACMRDGIVLTSLEEEQLICDIVERHCRSLNDDDRVALGYQDFLDDVSSGVACHHAGMIPMFKEAVEECFVHGLVKVVFATETLAVGINMPARAVVIEKLTKYTGEHHQLLKASEFTQLTGRAGRRGLDEIGYAISLWNPFVGFDSVVGLALSRSFRLTSAFRPTFNMAVNMVRSHSRSGTQHILNLSFAQFQADRDVVTSEATLERKRRELALLERDAGIDHTVHADSGIEGDDSTDADDLGAPAGSVEAEIALRGLRPGDVVVFDSSKLRGRGLVLSTASRRSGIRVTVLTPSKKSLEITARDLRSLPQRGAQVELPIPFEPARTEFIKEATQRLVKARVAEVEQRAIAHNDGPRPKDAPTSAANMKRLRRDIERLAQQSANRAGSVSARFMDVVDLLTELGYIDQWSLTDKGTTLAGIFHESDLLVVEAMSKGLFDGLSVVDLVAVTSGLIYEPRGGDVHPATRWPSDTSRQRFKRLEKLSLRIQEAQRSRGMHTHRAPHGGLAMECAAWAAGKPLSRILDPDITPGDFVRTIRQLIDLLRQISITASQESLRDVAADAVKALDRGVVTASQFGAGQ